jgi:ATP-dependent RNA circularization protein (DNA/RNA ligase family)
MKEYHKIQTVYLRDPGTKYKTLLEGQYAKPEFEYLKDNEWIFTEKVDGTNIRVKWTDGKLSFGGKTENAQIPTFLYDKLNELFTAKLMADVFPDADVCLYGEGYGAKIQKGGGDYIPDGISFILFDIKIGEWWLKREDVSDLAKKLNIDIVPEVGIGNLDLMVKMAREGYNSWISTNTRMAEGIVARPMIELKDRSGHRIITKIKYKDFQ